MTAIEFARLNQMQKEHWVIDKVFWFIYRFVAVVYLQKDICTVPIPLIPVGLGAHMFNFDNGGKTVYLAVIFYSQEMVASDLFHFH